MPALTKQQQIDLLKQAGFTVTTTKPKGGYVEPVEGVYISNQPGSSASDGMHGYTPQQYDLMASITDPYLNQDALNSQLSAAGIAPVSGSQGGSAPSGSTSSPAGGGTSTKVPPLPTAGVDYDPSQAYAQQVQAQLDQMANSEGQQQFAKDMQNGAGVGADGVLGQQAAMGAGQMGWPQSSSNGPVAAGAPVSNLGAGGNTNVPASGGQTLQNILNNPPNPGNFPGQPGSSPQGGFSQAPPRPGSGPSGITGHSAVVAQTTPVTTSEGGRASTPALPGQTATNPSSASSQQNAGLALQQMLDQWGLGDLASVVMQYIQQGYDATSIQYLLTQTPEYQRRFSGNAQRISNGLGALSPADYIATERAYQDILRSAGLPQGFYDSPDDFSKWIAGDVSPSEVQSRVNTAVHFAQSTDPTYRTALSAYYGIDSGHIAAYFLDNKRAMPLIQKQANAADIGAAALYNGLHLTNLNDALSYADRGVTSDQARSAYGAIGGFLPEEQAIASHFGQQYSQQTAEHEFLGQDGNAARTRRRLNSGEAALFGGSSGVGNGGLSSPVSGAY